MPRLIVGLILVIAAAGVFICDPAESRWLMPCPFHFLTGLYCPGCGSLRALHRLLHGNVAGALAMNGLMVLFIPVLAAFLVRPHWTRKPWVPKIILIVIILYWIARNIPVYPLILLAPH